MPAPLREQTACRSSAQGTKPAHDGREREFPLQHGPSVKRYTARRPVENVIRAGPDSDSQQSGVSIGAFEQGRRALPSSDAHGDDPVARFLAGHFVGDGADHARTGHSEWMTDGDRAIVDIEFFRVNAQAVGEKDALDSKSFVQPQEIDVIETQAATTEKFWHREN